MAISFIVEDGTARSDATSLCSVAVAGDYCDRHPKETIFQTLTQDQKEDLLIMATNMICLLWKFDGVKRTSTQSLEIPRFNMVDESGYSISSSIVPLRVQYAVAELARLLRTKDYTKDKTRGFSSASVGPLSVAFNQAMEAGMLPDSVIMFLKEFGESREVSDSLRVVRG